DTKIFTLRYFLVAHLFLLIGLAVLVWRGPFPLERGLVAALAVVVFIEIFVPFLQAMDVAQKPGAPAAAAYDHQQRTSNEPVVIGSPWRYFSILYHAPDRTGYFLYTDGRPIVHYYGSAVVTPQDLITEEQLRSIRSRRVWVVAPESGFWAGRMV